MGCLERYVLYGNALIGIAYAEIIAQHLGGHLLVLLLRYIKKNYMYQIFRQKYQACVKLPH